MDTSKKITIQSFHQFLAKEIFESEPSEQDIMCFMLLLHACRIALTKEANVEGGGTGFVAITSRHASEVVAKLYKDKERRDYKHWYHKWNADWDAYAILENIPQELIPRLQKIKELVESHPWIEKLEDEDWSIIDDINRRSAIE